MPTDLAELRRAVLVAFDGVECPQRDDIAPHECEECQAVCSAFTGLDWRAVPAAVIETHESVLPLLSPEAYRYLLGAWLLYAIDRYPMREGPAEYLVYDLAPNVPRETDALSMDWHRHRLHVLSREQLAVGERYLDAVEGCHDLARYFGSLAAGRAFRRELWEHRDEG